MGVTMGMVRKQFSIVVKERRPGGGRIIINTGTYDRDRDRVLPSGAQIENYLKNPVVQWGHNYREPWSTIGRTNELIITPEQIEADFDLRPAANENDPQNVVILLWDGGWINAASIGFNPNVAPKGTRAWEENERGGYDYNAWELLEWSLVPIPANQEALRRMVKAFGEDEPPATGGDMAWVRRMHVRNNMDSEQKLLAVFRGYSITVPEDATKIDFDEEGELTLVPHPDAGKTFDRKEATFVPPLAYWDEKWGDDAIYSISALAQPDEEVVKAWDEEYEVLELSEILLSLPAEKGVKAGIKGLDICRLTRKGVGAVRRMLQKGIDGREPDCGVDDGADASEGDGGTMKQADPDAGPDVDATTAAGDDDDNGLSPEQCTALGETLGQFLKTILEAWK